MGEDPKPASPTPVLLSWSGGKDSALALQALRADGRYQVTGLLTSVTRQFNRVSIHGVRRSLLHAQAASLGLPVHVVEIDAAASNEGYEAAVHARLDAIRAANPALTHIAFGDLFLEDVRGYRERMLAGSSWTPVFPLWQRDTRHLAEQFIEDGFSARLVCVDTTQLDGAFAGRIFARQLLSDFPAGVDPCGERGEFHTFVSDGPGFRHTVDHTVGDRVLRDERFMYVDLGH